jgi:hypothetical protein
LIIQYLSTHIWPMVSSGLSIHSFPSFTTSSTRFCSVYSI